MTAQHTTAQRTTARRTSTQHAPVTPLASAERAPRTRLRITRRGRAVVATLSALPIVAGAFVFGLNGGGAVASGEQADVAFQYVTVRSGESLWSLAEDLAPDSDPRDVVSDILSLNQLSDAGLEPGQRLAIPGQYELAR